MRNRPILLIVAGVAAFGLALPPLFAQGRAQDSGTDPLSKQEADVRAQEATRRDEIVEAILAARQTAGGRHLGDALKASLKRSLLSLSLEKLEAFLSAGGTGDIEAAVREASGPKVLGDAAADLVFTPVPPCRIVDTRSAAAGQVVAGTQRNLLVRSATGFAPQGGSATDCGIPDTATSVEMNFVAVGPAGPGDLRAFAFGGSLPNASVLNYSNVAGLNIANGIAQPVCNPAGGTPCTSDLTVQADVSSTHLVVDVVGYFNKVDKNQIKSFVVKSQTGTSVTLNAACKNVLALVVNAPVAGTVLVRGNALASFAHTNGAIDEIYVAVATNGTTCPISAADWGYTGFAALDSSLPTFTSNYHWVTVPAFQTFSVAAGATTFYLNAGQLAGGGNERISQAAMDATFFPN